MKSKYQFPMAVINAGRQMDATVSEIEELVADKERVIFTRTQELIELRIQVLQLKLEEDKEMIRRFTENGVFTERERDYILGEGEYK